MDETRSLTASCRSVHALLLRHPPRGGACAVWTRSRRVRVIAAIAIYPISSLLSAVRSPSRRNRFTCCSAMTAAMVAIHASRSRSLGA